MAPPGSGLASQTPLDFNASVWEAMIAHARICRAPTVASEHILSAENTAAADILIVGGGIAGAGAAYELSTFASVIVLEGESRCGYHSTGRSAASFTENYGGAVIRRLAIASRDFLRDPPPGFCEHPLLAPRGMITIAREEQLDRLAQELEHA